MLAMVREACRRGWVDYRYLTTTTLPPGDIWHQWDDTQALSEDAIVEIENEASEEHASVIRNLNVVSANCRKCVVRRPSRPFPISSDSDEDIAADSQDQQSLDAKSQRLRDLLQRYPYVCSARPRDNLPPRIVHGSLTEDDAYLDDSLKAIHERRHVKDWSAGSMFRFPRPTPAVHLPAYQGHRWKPFDRRYDEYEGGPILESLNEDCNPYEFVEEPYYPRGVWYSFRDYGYRLLPSFSQMFYLDPPVRLSDHILPVGVPLDYQPSCQIGDHVTGETVRFLRSMLC